MEAPRLLGHSHIAHSVLFQKYTVELLMSITKAISRRDMSFVF